MIWFGCGRNQPRLVLGAKSAMLRGKMNIWVKVRSGSWMIWTTFSFKP